MGKSVGGHGLHLTGKHPYQTQLLPEVDSDEERRTRPTYQKEEDKGRRAADRRSRNKIRDTVKHLQVHILNDTLRGLGRHM